MSETVMEKALRRFREDIAEVADMRKRLEKLLWRNPGDPVRVRRIRAADDCLHHLAYRISETYSEAAGLAEQHHAAREVSKESPITQQGVETSRS